MPRCVVRRVDEAGRRVRRMEARLCRAAVRLLGNDVRGDRGDGRDSVAVLLRGHRAVVNASALRRWPVRNERRESAADSHALGNVSRTAKRRVSVRPEYRPNGRTLAHPHEDRARRDSRAAVAAGVARDEPSRRARAPAQAITARQRRLAARNHSQPRAAVDGNDRRRPGIRAFSLGRSERQSGNAEFVRPDFAGT